jgi:hypothetical protein
MHVSHVKHIREAVAAAQRFAHESRLEGCDAADIDELSESLEHELERPAPNAQTLSTYLSSLLRSLRAEPRAGQICSQLDDAVKEAGVPVDW